MNLASALVKNGALAEAEVRGPRSHSPGAQRRGGASNSGPNRQLSLRSGDRNRGTEEGSGTATEASGPARRTGVGAGADVHNPDEAAAQFSEALRLQPDFAPAALHLGVVRWQQKQMDEALSLLQRAVQDFPQKCAGPLLSGPRVGRCGAAGEGHSRKCRVRSRFSPGSSKPQTQLGKNVAARRGSRGRRCSISAGGAIAVPTMRTRTTILAWR